MSPQPDILTLHASANPDKLALIEDPPVGGHGNAVQWTYRELNEQANRLANVLLALGLKREDKVLWCGPNSSGVVRMIHAARKVGASAVPLNYRLTAEESAYVVDNSDSVLAYIDGDHVELFAQIRDECPNLREVLVFDGTPAEGMKSADDLIAAASSDEPEVEPSDLAAETIIYTSGTTGKPKGAMRRGGGDPEQSSALVEFFGYTPDDVYLTTGPVYHSGPGGFMGIAFALGQTVVLQRKYDAEDWLRLIDQFKVTSSFGAPTPVRMACNLSRETKSKYDLSSMKRFVANAAPWSWALKEAYLGDFPEDSLFEVYGSTELGVNTILRPEDQRRKKGSCGKPSPMVDLVLFDEAGKEITEPNTEGELFVRSKSVFSMYYKAEEKFEADRRGEYHTVGDMAYFDEEGFYYICDRKHDMIISGGMNVYPAEIEASLEHHEGILDVAVIGIPSDEWGESVHAVVVRRGDDPMSEQQIIEYSREHLAGYKIPRSISFVDEIPRNGSGKILKKELRAPFWEGQDLGVA
ncbi:MAG: AMP-binding protein [Deltaproteobacteria bacterium]|nr:AMP-binding protein [Deltaproteobacteria bacterium]